MVSVETNTYSRPLHLSLHPETSNVQEEHIQEAVESLRLDYKGYKLYRAGMPGYARPFLRDTVKSARLFGNAEMMAHGLSFARALQAKESDALRGAHPGQIFHEYDLELEDGVELSDRPGKNTLFNACDSNAEFLITHEEYINLTGDQSLSRASRESIEDATMWILTHINEDNLFQEDPKFAGADSFALRVTYWKDSRLTGRDNGVPSYPVVYPFVHAQNIAGLRSAAALLDSEKLSAKAQDMVAALPDLFDHSLNTFCIARDSLGEVSGVSSDALHSLAYLRPGDLQPDIVERIIDSSSILETGIGYRTLEESRADQVGDDYHARTVWPHEQAEIHKAARKHLAWAEKEGLRNLSDGLAHVVEVSQRPSSFYADNAGQYPEIFNIDGAPGGCYRQLWSIAAADYYMKYLKANSS